MEGTPQVLKEHTPHTPESGAFDNPGTSQELEGTKEKYELELGKLTQGGKFDEVWVATYLDTLDKMISASEGFASEVVLREASERRALLIDGLVKTGFLREEGGLTDSESSLLH